MRRLMAIVFAAAFGWAAGAANAVAAQEVKVLGKMPAAFSAAESSASVKVLVSLPETVKPSQVRVRLAQVQQDRLADVSLQGHFQVDEALDADNGGAITVKVRDIATLLPGEYTLLLRPTISGKPAAPLTVTLERPPAQLAPLGKRMIDLRLGFFKPAKAAPAKLQIEPGDGPTVSSLREVKITEAPYVDGEGEAVAATLGVAAASAAPGQTLSLDLAPKDFPVGIAQGRLTLRSNDLKSAQAFDVEVRARLYAWWIPVFVAVGILVGFLLRVHLQRRVELATARLAGFDVIQKLQPQTRGIADGKFRDAVDRVLAELHEAMLGRDSVKIGEAGKRAAATVEDARKELELRLEAAAKDRKSLRDWTIGTALPPALQVAIAPLQHALDLVDQRLQACDAASAIRLLEDARSAAVQTLHPAAARAAMTLARLNEPLLRVRTLLDPTRTAERKVGESDLGTPPPWPGDSDTQVVSYLADWRALGVQRMAVASAWAVFVREDAGSLVALAQQRRVPMQPSLDTECVAVRDQYFACAAALEALASGDDPYLAIAPPCAAARDAVGALARKLMDQNTQLSADDKKRCEQHLAAGELFEAVRALPLPAAQRLHAGATGAVAFEEAGPGEAVVVSPPTVGRSAEAQIAAPIFDTGSLQTMRARTAGELAAAQGWQTAIVAAVLVGASYALFEGRFVGTPVELLGLFFFGFTSDLSVAKLMDQAGGWAAKPRA